MSEPSTIRPTKKQQGTLTFIANFIDEHGYSPSYREIMNGCNYTSVATASLHVNSLIKRGHLKKRDRSARSLEVVKQSDKQPIRSSKISDSQEKWLVEKIDFYFSNTEQESAPSQDKIDQLYVLVGSLKVLGLDGAAQSFMPRLTALKTKKGSK